MEEHADVAHGVGGDVADFLIREPFLVAQAHDLALALGQALDEGEQVVAGVGALERGGGIGLGREGGRGGVERAEAALGAEEVEGLASADGEEPGGARRGRSVSISDSEDRPRARRVSCTTSRARASSCRRRVA